jgi:phage tail sheath protein FI
LTISRITTATGKDVTDAWKAWAAANPTGGFTLEQVDPGTGTLVAGTSSLAAAADRTLDALKTSDTALYNLVKAALSRNMVTLPPSPAIAGVYANVDRARGVWKAPANVSLVSVLGPVSKITVADQDGLNIDPTSGKSINAIRSFTSKGTLVWGARTLAGNDNEWRYVNVRRLFSVIEESIQKATAFAVFEANDTSTWLKVKAMIDSYLLGLWERGALAGPTPAAAYFVEVGLGKTMTTQDILEGRMIVRVGIAAVRPAEFIILVFTHKLQEA